ncbi:hypothetical protein [Candidatus Uabimicrobium sp. HlEnr_7]|uniref:hypothetical protein n=1 Tax=Candidatus Uabimicrobium helgolandensis TaxID=3095367 RepID=UPI0035579497
MNKKRNQIIEVLNNLLKELIADYKFNLDSCSTGSMGEWYALFTNEELSLEVFHDRGDCEYIQVKSKIRRRPRAHLRGFSLSHIRGFLEGKEDHYVFESLEEEVKWLIKNKEKVLDPSFINLDELNKWTIKAARKLLG